MVKHDDLVRLYELSLELAPITNDEATERDFVLFTRPRACLVPELLTRSRRREYLRKYLLFESNDGGGRPLHPIIAAMPSFQYLERWMLSGMTKNDQDAFYGTRDLIV